MITLKRVCSLKTKQLRWTYDGKVLLKSYEVATIGRQNKLQKLQSLLTSMISQFILDTSKKGLRLELSTRHILRKELMV